MTTNLMCDPEIEKRQSKNKQTNKQKRTITKKKLAKFKTSL